jgi:hypothetical protein
MRFLALMALAPLLLIQAAPGQAFDTNRAMANYRAVMSGTKKLESLSTQERAEVIAVFRALRSQAPSGASSDCRSAHDRANSAADELESRARRLQQCAARRDFNDDCDTEARRARYAQDEYSSATSEVQSDCS